MKKVIGRKRFICGGIALVLVAAMAFAVLSPIPAAMAIRFAFREGNAVPPENYEDIASRVEAFKNLRYPSAYKDNLADIYVPKGKEGPFPVVLWIHGGAFVGGDKRDVEIYATALAAEGIAVVCMNYRRAPDAKYPVPVIQTEEAYCWLADIADTYAFDMARFALAGDSAGAHIAAQFAAIQSNAVYAREMGFEQAVPLETLRAVLLFCGPFDVAKIGKFSHPLFSFFMKRAAWAYMGVSEWEEPHLSQMTIANHITKDFPPAFITDGNRMSFEEHGRELAEALEAKGVAVETYFVSLETDEIAHEYQFIMNTEAGKESFQKVVWFLKRQADF